MRRILFICITALLTLSIFTTTASAQERHRLRNGEPYDIFYVVKPYFMNSQADLAVNYNKGFGSTFGIEYQFQEAKISVGAEIGYAYINPNSFKKPFLPRKHLFAANQIPFSVYANYYLHNEETYYNFLDRLKPYVGFGLGAIWGRYDYSLSTEENKQNGYGGYYQREYEGQSGFRVGFTPRIGLLIATTKHAFGVEYGLQYYFASDRLEKQQQYSLGLTYIYIIE